MARLPKPGLKALNWRRGALLVLVLLVALGAYKAQRIWGLARSLQGRLDELQAVADGSGDLELRDATESLRGAHADLLALRGQLALFMPLTRLLGWVPGVGGDLRAAQALLDAALALTEAGTIAIDGLEPLLELAEGEAAADKPLALVLQTLADARPDLETAQGRLATARTRRAAINEHALSARTAGLVARLDRYLPLMQTALDSGRLLPDLLGASGRRTYLILAQNNDELRATGGFISAVGTLALDGGEIVEITFEDSYAVDDFSQPYPDPPPPYTRYLGIDLWVFRDANWSPDFPTSARAAVELYQISRDLQVDGVLAVDQHALQAIVAALAPLEVEGWPEAVTGETVIPLIRLAWSPTDVENWSGFDPEWWRQRKSFMGDLVGAMRAKVEGSPDQVNWLALARALFRILDERHLQIWLAESSDPAVDLLAEQGWDGAIRQTTSDYLMVVDTNMGFNKVNTLVQQSLDYRVLVSADGTAQATLTVRHRNTSTGKAPCDHRPHYGVDYEDIMNRCYWDYLRVYVPSGSQLYAATAHPVAANLLLTGERQDGVAEILPEEGGKAVFASFLVLPRSQDTETRFVYQLPLRTLEPPANDAPDQSWRYRLLVQKQAGTPAIPLRVTLALPPGASVQSVESSDGAQGSLTVQRPEPSTVVFDTTLARDHVFEVSFRLNED